LAELAARGDRSGLRSTLGETLRAVLALTVPAALGLMLLGRSLLQFLYQRGAFDAAATDAVFVALRFYALGLVGHACLELAARTFFAQEDTITPLLIATGSAAVNIGLGIVLMGPLGHGGLALANSLAVSAEVLVLLLILRRRLGGVEGKQTLQELSRVLVATAVMGAVIGGVLTLGQRADANAIWTAAAGGAVGVAVYVAVSRLLGVRELYSMLAALVRR
jgi:putative peptidoglycan lipid II flippase